MFIYFFASQAETPNSQILDLTDNGYPIKKAAEIPPAAS
jgi:hypothetical protein